MRLACLQLDITWENREENFFQVEKLIQESAERGCEVVCLPELFATGFTMNSEAFAEKIPGSTSSFLKEQAKKKGIYLIGGFIEKPEDGQKPKNTCLVFDKEGRLISKYRKIHLFTLDKENENYSAGDSMSIFSLQNTRAVTFICYDLRFPELFRAAAEKGAQIIFVLANWPSSRETHWRTLLKARAIENQVYVAGVNRRGRSPFHDYSGASLIISPFGEVIAEGSEAEEIVMGDLNTEEVDEVRRNFPFFKDRKSELYDSLRKESK